MVVVTSFTVAHSVTLIASAFGMAPDALWFPPLIETLIALSIVYMAFENIVGAKLSRRWAITFGFGLVHGFGFSFMLRERLQFAGSHLVTSLLAFNVGVEVGQLVVLTLAIPALALLFRYGVSGADGHHPALGARGAHGLALGHGARRATGAVLDAHVQPRRHRGPDAPGDGRDGSGGAGLGAGELDGASEEFGVKS